ncbi:hypothetical protein ACQ4PT_065217 [Festuca glaucescens]
MARDKSGGSNAASLALRIATVALSVASTVMMASASTAGSPAPPASNVSYSDYSSLRYSLAANVVSAALQAAAVYLTMKKVRGGGSWEHEAKAAKSLAQLVDTAAQVLLYSSSALSFAVDDFGSCGRRLNGVCKTAGEFCRRVHVSGAISIAAAVALSVSLYIEDVPISVSLDGDGCKSGAGCERGCHCHH